MHEETHQDAKPGLNDFGEGKRLAGKRGLEKGAGKAAHSSKLPGACLHRA